MMMSAMKGRGIDEEGEEIDKGGGERGGKQGERDGGREGKR